MGLEAAPPAVGSPRVAFQLPAGRVEEASCQPPVCLAFLVSQTLCLSLPQTQPCGCWTLHFAGQEALALGALGTCRRLPPTPLWQGPGPGPACWGLEGL